MDPIILSDITTIWEEVCRDITTKYSVLAGANLVEYDRDMSKLAKKLLPFRGYTFSNTQVLVFSFYDTEFYLRDSSIGFTIENLLNLLEALDISLYHCLLFTNHYGIKDFLKKRNPESSIRIFENSYCELLTDPLPPTIIRSADDIEYHFCFMSHIRRTHRAHVRTWIEDENLSNTTLMAWHANKIKDDADIIKLRNFNDQDTETFTFDETSFIYPTPFTRIRDKFLVSSTIRQRYTLHAKILETTTIHKDINCDPNYQNFSAPWLAKTFINISAETVFDYPYPYITEKTFKSLWHYSPFIIVGAKNSLNLLKSFGFKTFNQWFDESYDQINNPSDRIEAVLEVLKNISLWSLSDCRAVYNEMKDILEFNALHYRKNFCGDRLEYFKQNL